MRALDRKLLRDLRLLAGQVLTIAMVVASGVGGLLTTLSAVDALALARDRFYAQAHFADVFASVERAPVSLASSLRQVPGVADVQTTTAQVVRIGLPGSSDAVLGQLIGIDRRQPPRMNLVTLRGASPSQTSPWPGAVMDDGSWPVWVSEAFANARQLRPGARLTALINGRERQLQVRGVALSPEFIFAGLWGMPDQRGFGVFWIDQEALDAAYDMQGAFNRLALTLAPGADERAVIDELQRRLARYGGREVIARADQPSHAMLDNEIQEQKLLGTVLPGIFFAVAAFLLHVVISRLVATQREQIAALKALGYDNAAIAGHYLKLVSVIVLIGLLLGVALGDWLGAQLLGLYAEAFRFPEFPHRLAPPLVLGAAALTTLTALLGTLSAIAATVRLAPAEAMRPPAPGRYRRTLVERLGLSGLPTGVRMVLRHMERRPLRTGLSVAGVAAAVALVVLGHFFRDAIDFIVETQFRWVMRHDVVVWTLQPVPDRARLELLRLPGVRAAESTRLVPVTLIHGHRRQRSLLRGSAAWPELSRIVDVDQRQTRLSGDGLVLTDRLATKLDLRVGDTVEVEVLEGRPRRLRLVLQATVRDMMGLNAYLERRALNRALGEDDLSGGFMLSLVPGSEPALLEATRHMPRVAGAFSKASMLRNMDEISARNIRIMSTVLSTFAAVIAFGVIYNNTRIALAERSWELASLRVLGFTRGEVSALLLGELALSVALALPLGFALGLGLVSGLTTALQSDQFLFPVVVQPRTYAWAALCIGAAAVASGWAVRRRVDRLDLVAALKTRE
ncbi:MAG: ABC transporter permease [Inhella sp.]|uniref:ABC transporter permease n=1 Tax=Inhella sp. TaxID=1921806 RepID=UPI00391F66F5